MHAARIVSIVRRRHQHLLAKLGERSWQLEPRRGRQIGQSVVPAGTPEFNVGGIYLSPFLPYPINQ